MIYPFILEYSYENYRQELFSEKKLKQQILEYINKSNLNFFNKRKAIKLASSLNTITMLLNYEAAQELNLSVEIWHSDCLEYNVNKVYEHIKINNINPINLKVSSIIKFCQMENKIDISKVKMRQELRSAKIENPIILLENDSILNRPFIINGNHRITNAYHKGEDVIKLYKLNPDDIVDCLSTDGYKEAYKIYKKLQKYINFRLDC